VPSPGPETIRYGGNTSCLEVVVSEDESLILDAGTGIRRLGLRHRRDPPERLDILLTHLHLDHVQGLGFFEPLFRPDVEVHIWGPRTTARTLEERLSRYLSPPLFPVRLSKIPTAYFHDVHEEPFRIGSVHVEAREIVHPGPTLGYRLTANGATIAYLPDHEPALGSAMVRARRPEWISGYTVAREADLLIHDGQYGDVEYLSHQGWGHSSVSHTVAFAEACHARRLLLFHHDPQHADDECDVLLDDARRLWRGDPDAVRSAQEETEIDLEGWAVAGAEPRALEA
jgi:phosphoribosyl 1,2-cyclic phosphodiesterase